MNHHSGEVLGAPMIEQAPAVSKSKTGAEARCGTMRFVAQSLPVVGSASSLENVHAMVAELDQIPAAADSRTPWRLVAGISSRPLLIIHGAADRLVPLRDAYLLYESAGEPKEIWTVSGSDHVQAMELDLEGYADRVTDFFRTALGSSAKDDRPSTRVDGSSRS